MLVNFVDGLERQSLVLYSATLFRGHAIKLLVPRVFLFFFFFFWILGFVWLLGKWQKRKENLSFYSCFHLFIYLKLFLFFLNWGFLVCGAGETVTIVGDHDPALLKYFDCTRSGPRSAFDSDVVYQFEIMEYVSLFCTLSLLKYFYNY